MTSGDGLVMLLLDADSIGDVVASPYALP